jgi:hypothetical protein
MWKTVNYEVRGRSHIKSDVLCQDKTLVEKDEDFLIIGLADGAGSAKYSHIGAEQVLKSIFELLTKEADDILSNQDGVAVKRRIIKKLKNDLIKKSQELDCDIKELASTLLVVAIVNEEFFILHIGDGVIGFLKNGLLKIASKPENGEFVNSTTFVTSTNVVEKMKMYKGKLSGVSGFVLMSDGTAESLYNKVNKELAPVIKKIMHRNVLVNSEVMYDEIKYSFDNIIVNNTQDDCSIVVASKICTELYGFLDMPYVEKLDFLGIKNKKGSKKRIKRYTNIMEYINTPKTNKEIAKYIHLKEKYIKKHIKRLLDVGCIEHVNNRIVRIDIFS